MRMLTTTFLLAVLVGARVEAQQPPARQTMPKGPAPAQPQPPPAQPPARGAPAAPAAQGKAASPVAVADSRAADEQAIRQLVDGLLKAYNAHDARAMANLFVADGEMVDEDGDVVQGRAAIEALMKMVFE